MIDHGQVRFSTPPTRVRIDAWRVKLFCQAIGETDAVYWNDDAARAAGHPACPVPPTFLKAMEGEHFSSAELMRRLQVPLTGVLHAEQSFDHRHPVHVGDVLEVSRTVQEIHDKKDGAMTFIVVDTDYVHEGRSAASSRQTILVRNKIAA
jgi:acyl dehydratase